MIKKDFISLRVSSDTKEFIEKLAQINGLSVSTFMIECILNSKMDFKDDEIQNIKKRIIEQNIIDKSRERARAIYEITNFEKRIIRFIASSLIDVNEILRHIEERRPFIESETNGKQWENILNLTKEQILDMRLDMIELKSKGLHVSIMSEMGFDGIKKVLKDYNIKYKAIDLILGVKNESKNTNKRN